MYTSSCIHHCVHVSFVTRSRVYYLTSLDFMRQILTITSAVSDPFLVILKALEQNNDKRLSHVSHLFLRLLSLMTCFFPIYSWKEERYSIPSVITELKASCLRHLAVIFNYELKYMHRTIYIQFSYAMILWNLNTCIAWFLCQNHNNIQKKCAFSKDFLILRKIGKIEMLVRIFHPCSSRYQNLTTTQCIK